jgi:hypothetical protein
MNNARFWDCVGYGWVKITLRPGQQLHHSSGGPTDEGYHWVASTWEHDHDQVRMIEASRSRDCDGRLDTYTEHVCPLAELNAKPWDPSPSGRIPKWRRVNSSQRDYAAEAAGY